MVDDADLIEKYELELWDIIQKMHKDSIRYSVIHFILSGISESLELQKYCEDQLNK